MKRCPRCSETKELSFFYPSSKTKDGSSCWCIACDKEACRSAYLRNRDKRLAQEKARRGNNVLKHTEQIRRHRAKHPEKYAARTAVGNAVRLGRLIKQPCDACGDLKVEAHHEDYSKPLEVRWFCNLHHKIHEGRSVLA